MRRIVPLLAGVCLLMALFGTPAAAADVPPLPHAFYGAVEINGSPAPVGTEVEAKGEGVLTGIEDNPTITTVAGIYGTSNPVEHRLIVQSDKDNPIEEGATITFYVDDEPTGQTAEWHSGEVTELDLTVTIEAPPVGPPARADFSVSSLSVLPVEVEPGETVTIRVSVANTGGKSGSYTVVLKIDGVKEAEETVTIAAGESQDVSFSVTREEIDSYAVTVDGLSGSFTVVPVVVPPPPAAFSVSSLSIQPIEVEPDEAVTITVSVANTGGESGSYTVVLNIDGVKEDEETVTIAAGNSRTVSFSVTREEAGSYTVTVDGLTGSFTVVPVVVVPPEPAAFSVSSLSVLPVEVESGEMVTIAVLVDNIGGKSGSYTVILKIDGVKEADETVTIAAGESQEVSFSVTREEAGSYTVAVDGLSGSFTVVAPPVGEEEEEEEVPIKPAFNWPLYGGIIGGVVVVAGLLYYFLVFRRRYY